MSLGLLCLYCCGKRLLCVHIYPRRFSTSLLNIHNHMAPWFICLRVRPGKPAGLALHRPSSRTSQFSTRTRDLPCLCSAHACDPPCLSVLRSRRAALFQLTPLHRHSRSSTSPSSGPPCLPTLSETSPKPGSSTAGCCQMWLISKPDKWPGGERMREEEPHQGHWRETSRLLAFCNVCEMFLAHLSLCIFSPKLKLQIGARSQACL